MVDMPRLQEKIITKLKKDRLTPSALAEELKADLSDVLQALGSLGTTIPFDIKQRGRHVQYHINTLPDTGNVYDLGGHDGKKHSWRFAYMGDTHIASTFHLPKSTKASLDRLVELGVKHVFHSGDVVDGNGIYKGHSENILTSSVEKQTDLAAELFSKYDGKLRFWAIAGNHDYSFTQQNGAKPLALIEAKTNNFVNLGDMRADVKINDLRIRLLHGAGGRAYARSYPSQTYLRDYFSGLDREDMKDIPHFLFLGHFHTKVHIKDHGIEVFQPGSFQDGDNEYCIRRGLTGPTGLWVLNVEHTGSHIDSLSQEYVSPSVTRKEKGVAFAKTSRSYRRSA